MCVSSVCCDRAHALATQMSPSPPFVPPCQQINSPRIFYVCIIYSIKGCSFSAYSWKLPAYSRASLLTVVFGSFLLQMVPFCLQLEPVYLQSKLSCLQWDGASNKHPTDCKQKSSTVSKEAPSVSTKASSNAFERRGSA